jgi:hypothetical protein
MADEELPSDVKKRMIRWEDAVDRWEKLMDGFRDRVRAKLKARVMKAIARQDWVEALEELRCWWVFRRAWKAGVKDGKSEIRKALWKQASKPGYGRARSRRLDSGKPVPMGRPTYAFMSEENKRLYRQRKASKPKRPRGRPRKRALPRRHGFTGRRRGRPQKYRRGFILGHHRVFYRNGKLVTIY